jgi:hypothetical protein
MGQMQPKAGGVEQVKSTIRSIETNTQTSDAPLKQSITQNVTNSGLGSGEFKVPGAHKGKKN